jgi:hypothetical protein
MIRTLYKFNTVEAFERAVKTVETKWHSRNNPQTTEDDHDKPIHGLLIKLLTPEKAIQSSWTFAPKWFFMEGLKF